MSDLRKAAEQAVDYIVEALARHDEAYERHPSTEHERQVIVNDLEALRQALAQPEPGPVAWHEPGAYGNVTTHKDWALANGWEPLYKEKT